MTDDLSDAHTERGAALAILMDEIGACARGEMPSPDPRQLAEWLAVLNKVARSNNSDNDHDLGFERGESK